MALASYLQFQILQNVHKRHAQDTIETAILINCQSITAFEYRALVTIVDINSFLCMYCILFKKNKEVLYATGCKNI